MEGISQKGRRRGLVTRSFLLTWEAGWGERGESGLALPSPCLVVRPSVQTADRERRILLRGPVVIDPVFSSAWAWLITFYTPGPEQNIRNVGT